MPRRLRRSKRRDEWTMFAALALSIGPAPGSSKPDDDMLAAVYLRHRDRVLADYPGDGAPWGFWRFEPDVPDELRAARPTLREVHEDARREHAERDAEAAVRIDLDRSRRRWLGVQPLDSSVRAHGSRSAAANGRPGPTPDRGRPEPAQQRLL